MVNEELIPKVNAIIKFLKKRYSAKVIILVGSRVVGDYKSDSDWDIYMFTEIKIPKETPDELYQSLPEILKNDDLDIYKNSFDTNTYSSKLYRDLRNSEVILDTKEKFGKKLVKKSLELYKKGPKKWTKEYAQGRLYKARRYMKKFKDLYNEKKYDELFLRIAWHYSENIIDWWFGIRQEFPLRPQQAFPYIKKTDPKFYEQIQLIVSDKTNYQTKINAFDKIHKILFGKQKYKELIK